MYCCLLLLFGAGQSRSMRTIFLKAPYTTGVSISAIIDVFINMDVYIYYRDCVYSMYIIRRKTNAY